MAVHIQPERFPLFDLATDRGNRAWEIQGQLCPACHQPIIYLIYGTALYIGIGNTLTGVRDESDGIREETLVWPQQSRRPIAVEVPDDLAEDYREAAAVLPFSAKASAALTRRCLQHLFREYARTKSKDLADQIKEVVAEGRLSSDLNGQLDAVRNIGNFAAHPQKNSATNEILPVEPHEAEWNLDVLDELFDHYFVKPARNRERIEELNKKLIAASKPPIPLA